MLSSDQNVNLFSALMKEVSNVMGMRKLNTTTYHLQADGLVENFNHTLQAMIAKGVDTFGGMNIFPTSCLHTAPSRMNLRVNLPSTYYMGGMPESRQNWHCQQGVHHIKLTLTTIGWSWCTDWPRLGGLPESQ